MFMDNDIIDWRNYYGVIYCLTCRKNGKVYIGQTTDFRERMSAYKRYDCKGQKLIYRALKKHKAENFNYDIIDTATNKEQLDVLECYHMALSMSRKRKYGYNDKEGGSNGKHSAETKSRMSVFQKNRKRKIGLKRTEETKKRMSLARKGIKFKWSEEAKQRNKKKREIQGSSRKGKKRTVEQEKKEIQGSSRKGKKRTVEQKKRMSYAQNNSVVSQKNIRILIEKNKGKPKSSETRQRMSEAKKGKKLSEDHKKNISKGGKGKHTKKIVEEK